MELFKTSNKALHINSIKLNVLFNVLTKLNIHIHSVTEPAAVKADIISDYVSLQLLQGSLVPITLRFVLSKASLSTVHFTVVKMPKLNDRGQDSE